MTFNLNELLVKPSFHLILTQTKVFMPFESTLQQQKKHVCSLITLQITCMYCALDAIMHEDRHAHLFNWYYQEARRRVY